MTSYQKELQALRDGSKRPENYGKPWTDKEISELRALFLQCYDISIWLSCLAGQRWRCTSSSKRSACFPANVPAEIRAEGSKPRRMMDVAAPPAW